MQKWISLLLTVCMLAGAVSAWAENSNSASVATASGLNAEPAASDDVLLPGEGYDFDFTLSLHTGSFSPQLQKKAEGYAQLLKAIRFQGSFLWAEDGKSFELSLNMIPASYSAGTISIGIHGAENAMFLTSNLFGEKEIALSFFSMLGFFAKMSEHLGIPLHYLALLYPYTWKYGFGMPIADWQFVMNTERDGIVSAEDVFHLRECWYDRVNNNEQVVAMINALCKDTDIEESFLAVMHEVPDYFYQQVLEEGEIYISREAGKTTWSGVNGPFFTEIISPQGTEDLLSLPRMSTGYQPIFSLKTFQENSHHSGQLLAKLLSGTTEPDIVNLEASWVSVPENWPTNDYSLLSVNLTGALLPNIGVSCVLSSEENGHIRLDVRKPTVDAEPGDILLTLEGEMLPPEGEVWVREYNEDEENTDALDLFVANDTTIMAFLPDMMEPLLKGAFNFLVGIPTDACQTIMDDLTELGVFQVLMGN